MIWTWRCPSCGRILDVAYFICSCGYESNSSERNYSRLKQQELDIKQQERDRMQLHEQQERDKKQLLEKRERDRKQRQYDMDQQREQQKRDEAQRLYYETQQSTHNKLVEYITTINRTLADLPKRINAAEIALDEAETEFAEGVFAPFWDAIERVATNIANFDNGLNQIGALVLEYKVCQNNLNTTPPFNTDYMVLEHNLNQKNINTPVPPPPFNIDFKLIPIPTKTITRMRCIVRFAQKDPNFAMIYELRKTNKILVEGFTSLGQALNDMKCLVSDSTEALSRSISDLAASNRYDSQLLYAGVQALSGQIQSDAEAKRDYERMELDMLDNIQRRRKPSKF